MKKKNNNLKKTSYNLKKKWFFNYKLKKFFTPSKFYLLKLKKKVKTFKFFKFNFFFKFKYNFKLSNSFNFYRKNKLKKSLDIRFLYLKLWEVIKEKKFKLHLPFLFLIPSFKNKTFLTVKSLFLKFFNFKNIIFSKRFFTFNNVLIKKNDELKKNISIIKFFFCKSFFISSFYKNIKKNLQKKNLTKIMDYSQKFIINSYWSFLKVFKKQTLYNNLGVIHLNLLNLGLLKFRFFNNFIKI